MDGPLPNVQNIVLLALDVTNNMKMQSLKLLFHLFAKLGKIEKFTCLQREALEHLLVQQSALADLEKVIEKFSLTLKR